MTEKIRCFEDLTARELYEILRLRSEVFIVEQGGRYLDQDGVDYDSIHLFYEDPQGRVLGCIRIFPKEDEPGTVQLGRLVVRDRGLGLGRQLMDRAARIARTDLNAGSLYLTGRADALGFYRKCGYEIQAPGLVDGVVQYYHLRKDL